MSCFLNISCVFNSCLKFFPSRHDFVFETRLYFYHTKVENGNDDLNPKKQPAFHCGPDRGNTYTGIADLIYLDLDLLGAIVGLRFLMHASMCTCSPLACLAGRG